MENKRVVVTGGANGIGKGVVNAFLRAGAKVFVLDIDCEENSDGDIHYIKTDVRRETDIKKAFDWIKAHFGPVHILINNAGVSKFKPFLELSLDDWNDVLQTNLTSVFLVSKEAVKQMQETNSACSIVNISSTRADMSEPDSEAYAATKGGIKALTHAMALSLEELNITVNAIAPGWIHTADSELREVDHKQHPSKRVGKPEDIARACLFLTDSKNDFINGETIIIDGGMTKKMMYEL